MIISTKDILDRAFELMEFCHEYSQKINKEIVFEIGTEEQSGSTNSFEEIEFYLNKIKIFFSKNKIPFPCFIVIQSGTKVIETENVGSFESPIRIKKEIAPEIQIFKALELCEKYGVWMKEHNAIIYQMTHLNGILELVSTLLTSHQSLYYRNQNSYRYFKKVI